MLKSAGTSWSLKSRLHIFLSLYDFLPPSLYDFLPPSLYDSPIEKYFLHLPKGKKMAIVVVLKTVCFWSYTWVWVCYSTASWREGTFHFFSLSLSLSPSLSLSLCCTPTYLFSSPVLILLNVLGDFWCKERVVLNKHEEKEFESRKSGMSRTINMTPSLSLSLSRSPFSRTPSFFLLAFLQTSSYILNTVFIESCLERDSNMGMRERGLKFIEKVVVRERERERELLWERKNLSERSPLHLIVL